MNIYKKIVSLALLLTAVAMTTPTFNSAELDLPAAIADVPESPGIVRTGVVSEITEADNITVRISGSNVLVRASYLFPQYLPVLGDNVLMVKQDAQWFVWGTPSGPINSLVMNPGFEDGTTGATPSDWFITSVSGAGGTITFQKQAGSYLGQPLAGNFVGAVDFTSNGAAATSQSNISSEFIPANEGEEWTAAMWLTGGIMSSRTLSLQSLLLEFYDSTTTLIVTNTVSQYSLGDVVIPRTYIRPFATTPSFIAPAGTAQVRLRLNVQFSMPTPAGGTVSTVFYDYMILRKV